MKKIFIHAGLAKTGTTSIQTALSNQSSPEFEYLGRKYRDKQVVYGLLDDICQNITLNELDNLKVFTKKLIKICEQSKYDDIVISHENLIRPNEASLECFKEFVRELSKEFHVTILISYRNTSDLATSRFLHDISKRGVKFGNYFHLKKIAKYLLYISPIRKKLIHLAITSKTHCIYPFCVNGRKMHNCACTIVKKLDVNFNDFDYIKNKLSEFQVFGYNIDAGEINKLYTSLINSETDSIKSKLNSNNYHGKFTRFLVKRDIKLEMENFYEE